MVNALTTFHPDSVGELSSYYKHVYGKGCLLHSDINTKYTYLSLYFSGKNGIDVETDGAARRQIPLYYTLYLLDLYKNKKRLHERVYKKRVFLVYHYTKVNDLQRYCVSKNEKRNMVSIQLLLRRCLGQRHENYSNRRHSFDAMNKRNTK